MSRGGSTASKLIATMQKLRIFQFNHLIPKTNNHTSSTHQIQKEALLSITRRIPIYLASILGFISIGTITHLNDEYYWYYPLPFAIDIGDGASMMPTILPSEIYLRDCYSNRFIWLNWQHLQQRVVGSATYTQHPTSTKTQETATTAKQHQHLSYYNRSYQKGDIVTIFNPFSKNMVCKRIIGTEGDKVRVFGEYAQSYHELGNQDYGVPSLEGIDRYNDVIEIPFCYREAQKRKDVPLHQITIRVPKNHVWVEGDNPLCSIDSRHYGPLPISSLRGRVALRLWPITRCLGEPKECCTLSCCDDGRPAPFMSVDEILESLERKTR